MFLQAQTHSNGIPPPQSLPHIILCLAHRPALKLWEITWPAQKCLLEVWETGFLAGNLQLVKNGGQFYVLLSDPYGNEHILSGTVILINYSYLFAYSLFDSHFPPSLLLVDIPT